MRRIVGAILCSMVGSLLLCSVALADYAARRSAILDDQARTDFLRQFHRDFFPHDGERHENHKVLHARHALSAEGDVLDRDRQFGPYGQLRGL